MNYLFSIRYKVPAALLLLGVLLVGVLTWGDIRRSGRVIELESRRRMESLGNLLSSSAEYDHQRGDLESFRRQISALSTMPHLNLALACDDSGLIFATTRSALKDRKIRESQISNLDEMLKQAQLTMASQVRLSSDRQSLSGAFPFRPKLEPGELRPLRAGVVYLDFDLAARKRVQVVETRNRAFLVGGVVFLALVGVWCYFHYALLWRTGRLVEAARRLAAGDLNARVSLRGGDELAELGDGFNRMAEEITRRTRSLELGEARLAGIISSTYTAIISVDEQMRVVLFNPAAELMFGWKKEEMLGQKVDRLLPERFRPEHETLMQRFAETGQTSRSMAQPGKILGVRSDGLELPIEATISRVQVGGEMYLTIVMRDIRDRLAAEEKLRLAKSFSDELINSVPGLFFCFEHQGRFLRWNQMFETVTGYSSEEVDGMLPTEFVVPEDRERTASKIQEAFVTGQAEVELTVLTKQGRKVPYQFSARVVTLDGKPALIGVGMDVSQRKEAEQLLRISERRFNSVFRNSPANMCVNTVDSGRVLDVNDRYCEFFGYTREELIGRAFSAGIQLWVDYSQRADVIRRLKGSGFLRNEPIQFRCKNGEIRDTLVSYALLDLPDESEQILVSMSFDVTDRIRAENALRESETRFRELAENIQEVFWSISPDASKFHYISPAYETVWGRSCRSLYENPRLWMEAIHPEDREWVAPFAQRELASGKYDVEFRIMRLDGSFRWIRDRAFPVRDSHGVIIRVVGVAEDITKAKESADAVLRLAAFPQLNPNPVIELKPTGEISYSNAAAVQLATQLGFATVEKMLPRESVEIVRNCLAVGRNRPRVETQVAGRILSWSFYSIPSLEMVHCYASDITEMRNLEEQFRQSQKMEVVGQLAGGIAHDFNNLLTVIQINLDLIKTSENSPKEERDGFLHEVELAAGRAANLTRQLLAFSRRQLMRPVELDLSTVIQDMTKLLRRVLGENIMLQVDFAPALPAVRGDVSMIEQVVMNLAVNARDAMPAGGRLTISTRLEAVSEEAAALIAGASPGQFVCLVVSDTGSGIKPEHLSRIFEPFFTTKEVGKGTGLGLATVYGIVKQHQGWIQVASTFGQGSTFTVRLPALAAAAAPEQPERVSEPAPRGNETILLVEDDAGLRTVVRMGLSHLGYRVIEAESAEAAFEALAQATRRPDLLLTDVIMPGGLTGRDLAVQLKASMPGLRIIYTSGYSAEVLGKEFILEDSMNFLAKPYEMKALAKAVRTCLDSPGDSESAGPISG